MGAPPAGWYSDPAGAQRRRYWDGAQWTDHYGAPELRTAQFHPAHAIAWVIVPVLLTIFVLVESSPPIPLADVVGSAIGVGVLLSIIVGGIYLAFQVDERRKKRQRARDRDLGLAINADTEDGAYRRGDDLHGMHGQYPPSV